MVQYAESIQHRNSKGRSQKNKRGDSKVKSNDNPEIPDRGGDIKHPGPPFGDYVTEAT